MYDGGSFKREIKAMFMILTMNLFNTLKHITLNTPLSLHIAPNQFQSNTHTQEKKGNK